MIKAKVTPSDSFSTSCSNFCLCWCGGQVSRFTLVDGKAHFRNRYVRTQGFLEEQVSVTLTSSLPVCFPSLSQHGALSAILLHRISHVACPVQQSGPGFRASGCRT